MSKESLSDRDSALEHEPQVPSTLPPELADFLKDQPIACVTQSSDRGTVFVVKLPLSDVRSVQGRVPVHVRQELYEHPAAPVIRMVMTIYDQPDRPLAIETFFNVQDPQQRADFANLAEQDKLRLLFYDESLRHRLTKVVPNHLTKGIQQLLREADTLIARIPAARFDFDRAKADVMRAAHL